MAEVSIDQARFHRRIEGIRQSWLTERSSLWNGADALCIAMGKSKPDSEEEMVNKQRALHMYLTGYEFPDTLLFITKTKVVFIGTKKKWAYWEPLREKEKPGALQFVEKTKDESQLKENFLKVINNIRGNNSNAKMGFLVKGEFDGPFVPLFLKIMDEALMEKVDIAKGVGYVLSVKDEEELDLAKRASVLSNKVLKHSLYKDLENVLDKDQVIKHSDFANNVEAVLKDPTKIDLRIPEGDADSCYNPIIQSGGSYDIKVSAQSDDNNLKPDVIVCQLGAMYKNYCANVARTFFVNAPPKVETTYKRLIAAFERALAAMTPGKPMKDVMTEVKTYLAENDEGLIPHLPKNFGFAIGLEFRDSSNVLNEKNDHVFKKNMVFCVSVGFHNVSLEKSDRGGLKLDKFSVLLSDTVKVVEDGPAEILTKFNKDYQAVSWNMGGDDDSEEESEEEEEAQGTTVDESGARRSTRNRAEKAAAASAAAERLTKQRELMEKRAKKARQDAEGGVAPVGRPDEEKVELQELDKYKSPSDYPSDVRATQVRVDLSNECIFLPICGHPVPFHVSMIRSVNMPDPDRATYLRVNFYGPGASGKDVPKNTLLLIEKYAPIYAFIKDMTFRSLDAKSLSTAYRLFQELRKRIRQRENQAEQERGLVEQTKLVRIRDQRVPRLQDLTMRPTMSGKKCVGTLESHTNGLRFTSTRGEVLDIMYNNIAHAIYQPCHKSIMVLVHFHLKDPIMVGKKKQVDVQFYTEVIDASENLDAGRRSSYDPDEMEAESREREMRKKVNAAFKDFCKKVERVATHYKYTVEFDIPYNDLGFYGNCSKEMVFITPTLRCLVNLTETPFFCLDLSKVDHVHFERVIMSTKNFDVTFLYKDYYAKPVSITLIEMKWLDQIQEWLTDIGITCTVGGANMDWNALFEDKYISPRDNAWFWSDVDADGVPKPIGWSFLDADGTLDNDEDDEEGGGGEEEESEFSQASASESEEESDEESFEDDEESSDDDDDSDGDSEEGKDWDELERDARESDRQKRSYDEDEPAARKKRR